MNEKAKEEWKPVKNGKADEEMEKPMKNEKADKEWGKSMIHEERESQWRTGKPMKNCKVHEERDKLITGKLLKNRKADEYMKAHNEERGSPQR